MTSLLVSKSLWVGVRGSKRLILKLPKIYSERSSAMVDGKVKKQFVRVI